MLHKHWCRGAKLLCLVVQCLVAAQARAADLSELVAAVNDARAEFRAVTADDVALAKAAVRDQLIETGETFANRPDWRDYLLWDRQFQEFDNDEIGSVDVWRQVYSRVARDADLLEKEVFQEYRSLLHDLINCIKAFENPHLEDDYQAVLTDLAEILSRCDGPFQAAEAARLAELLAKLHRQRQVPELIESIRQHAAQPNLILEIPGQVLAGEQRVKEDFSFRQVVRGSPVEVSGTLEADQSFSLETGENAITVKSVVAGSSSSNSLGRGNGVTVRSSGSLRFESASNVLVNMEGVAASGFDTTGVLTTQIQGVSTNYRGRAAARARRNVYDRREADRQAAQSQALADLDSTFNARLDGLIAPLQAAYRQNVYLPLIRHDRLPHRSNFASNAERATVQIWCADNAQLAAPGDPPWSAESGEQLRLAIHESAVNNTSALLEGRVRSLVDVLQGQFFEYIAETAEPSERLDIRFNDEVAARAIFREGVIELRLMGSEFILDGSTYPGMEITLRYHLENDGSPLLHLSEPPQVDPHIATDAERPRLGLRGIALRRILANVLDEQAVDTIDLTEMSLPEPFGQLGKFQTQRLNIEDGWLILEAIPVAEAAAELPSDEAGAATATEDAQATIAREGPVTPAASDTEEN